MAYSSLVGMEIINKSDIDSASDRILWDNILMKTMPQNRSVWGFSNDDFHATSGSQVLGRSYNVFLMQSNTVDNFLSAMTNGNFYAVARVARRELGNSFIGTGPVPHISSIAVNENEASITITAQNITRIEWIANGAVIQSNSTTTNSTLNLQNFTPAEIGSYVRVNIRGPGGIIFTQPFMIIRS